MRALMIAFVLTLVPALDASAQSGILDRKGLNTMNDLPADEDDRECAANLLRYDKERAASDVAVQKLVGVAMPEVHVYEQDLYYSEKALKILNSKICRRRLTDLPKNEREVRRKYIEDVKAKCVAIDSKCKATKHW